MAYRDLDLADIAARIAAGDEAARAESQRRLGPLALTMSRTPAARVAHRGVRCSTTSECDACIVVAADILDRLCGHPAGLGRRQRVGVVERWYKDGCKGDFAAFARRVCSAGSLVIEARRAICAARGLKTRFRPNKAMRSEGPAAYAEFLALSTELGDIAHRHGLSEAGDFVRITNALWIDAIEANFGTEIDADRVARLLLGDPVTDVQVHEIDVLSRAVDLLIAYRWPEWAEANLDRPRSLSSVVESIDLDDADTRSGVVQKALGVTDPEMDFD